MGENYIFQQNARRLEPKAITMWKTEEGVGPNTTLSDSFQSVVDDGSPSQYFSFESSAETILNEISQLDVSSNSIKYNQDDQQDDIITTEADDSNEMVFYRIDGSEDLYGIQIAEDDDGNMQKYQFKVRQNDEGQFETIPGTIKVIPLDSNAIIIDDSPTTECIIDQEVPLPSEACDDTVIEAPISNAAQAYLDIKKEFLKEDVQIPDDADYHQEEEDEEYNYEENAVHVDCKEGILDVEDPRIINKEEPVVVQYELEEPNIDEQEVEYEESHAVQVHDVEDDGVENRVLMYLNNQPVEYQDEAIVNNGVEHHHLLPEILIQEPQYTEDEVFASDCDENIVDDHHVTGEDEIQPFEEVILKSDMYVNEYGNIKTKTTINKVCKLAVKPNKSNPIHLNGKENTNYNANSRSVLKSSQNIHCPERIKQMIKGKATVQAKFFQNYLAQTTIVQAPVRQERMPRKQKIEPLERSGEEIVVQEVVVSNGFVETREDGVVRERKPLIPTELILLSDSDDDGSAKKRKRKSKKSKQIEIVISDSDGDDVIFQPSEQKENIEQDGAESSLAETSIFKKPELLKYKCSHCDEIFKNKILLSRHEVLHDKKRNKFECSFCKKIFPDNAKLNIHKRSHVKERMVNTTSIERVSPRKSMRKTLDAQKVKHNQTLTEPNALNKMHSHDGLTQRKREETVRKATSLETLNRTKSTDKAQSFKCSDCSKTFSSSVLLTAHTKLHKKFTCKTCSNAFTSKIIFDDHLRRLCLKSPRKSTNPVRILGAVKCDACSAVLKSFTELATHKVEQHGAYTPNKLLGKEKRRETMTHTGIPANAKFQSAFSKLRAKLRE